VRHLTLAEALTIAEAVTGTRARTLARVAQLGLPDSALHTPQAGCGDIEFYPAFADNAAVLVGRLAPNHPLPDGTKRLAWQALTMFGALNGHRLEVPADEAVDMMLAIAVGGVGEATVAEWPPARLSAPPPHPREPGNASR
jgi:death-on-curing protein